MFSQIMPHFPVRIVLDISNLRQYQKYFTYILLLVKAIRWIKPTGLFHEQTFNLIFIYIIPRNYIISIKSSPTMMTYFRFQVCSKTVIVI